MDEKDLKVQALLEEITRLTGANADLRVQLTILSNKMNQQPQDGPPMLPLEGDLVD